MPQNNLKKATIPDQIKKKLESVKKYNPVFTIDSSFKENLTPEQWEAIFEELKKIQPSVRVEINDRDDLHEFPDDFLSLKSLEVNNCKNLTKLPSEAPNLKSINIIGCDQLKTVSEGLLHENVEHLLLRECENLTANLSALTNLFRLDIEGIKGITELPETSPNLQALKIDGCQQITNVPQGLLHENLRALHMRGCPNTTANLSGLTNIAMLYLEGNKAITSLPEVCTQLVYLDISGCENISRIPQELIHSGLKELNMNGCTRTSVSLSALSGVESLGLQDCKSVVNLPSNASKLEKVDVSGCTQFSELPAEIYQDSLQELCFSGATKVTKPLPEALKKLRVSNLSESIKIPPHLKVLEMYDCKHQTETPELKDLEKLVIKGCVNMKEVGNVVKAQEINIEDCTSLRELPKELGELRKLFAARSGLMHPPSFKPTQHEETVTVEKKSFKPRFSRSQLFKLQKTEEIEVTSTYLTLPKLQVLDFRDCTNLSFSLQVDKVIGYMWRNTEVNEDGSLKYGADLEGTIALKDHILKMTQNGLDHNSDTVQNTQPIAQAMASVPRTSILGGSNSTTSSSVGKDINHRSGVKR